MTTIITRLFQSQTEAKQAAERLIVQRLPSSAIKIVTAPKDAEDTALKAWMHRLHVHDDAIDTYANHVKDGRALLVVKATYKPLMAKTVALKTLARHDDIDVPGVTQEHYIPDVPEKASSVLKDHPLIFTGRIDHSRYEGNPVSDGLGLGLLTPRNKKSSAISGGKFMSRAFWPQPLLSTKERKISAIRGGKHMSRAFWPMPLISRRKHTRSVFHGLTLSRWLGWPTVS